MVISGFADNNSPLSYNYEEANVLFIGPPSLKIAQNLLFRKIYRFRNKT
jgi:hypothetical protein